MKKLIALLLAVVFVSASVVGCGGDTKPSSGGAKPSGTGAGGTGGGKEPGK